MSHISGKVDHHAKQMLRLTYRLNSPNNTVKIWHREVSERKLFTLRHLWGIDGEVTSSQKNQNTKVAKRCSSDKKGKTKDDGESAPSEERFKSEGVSEENQD
jgi:hypothetical protein